MDIYKDIVDLHNDRREKTSKVESYQEKQRTEPQTLHPEGKRKNSTCFVYEFVRPVRMESSFLR